MHHHHRQRQQHDVPGGEWRQQRRPGRPRWLELRHPFGECDGADGGGCDASAQHAACLAQGEQPTLLLALAAVAALLGIHQLCVACRRWHASRQCVRRCIEAVCLLRVVEVFNDAHVVKLGGEQLPFRIQMVQPVWRVLVDVLRLWFAMRIEPVGQPALDLPRRVLLRRRRAGRAAAQEAKGAARAGGFYSSTEFDLSKVLKPGKTYMEIGRTCVDPDFRTGAAIGYLWGFLAEYMEVNRIDYLMGCCSIPVSKLGSKTFAGDPYKSSSTPQSRG